MNDSIGRCRNDSDLSEQTGGPEIDVGKKEAKLGGGEAGHAIVPTPSEPSARLAMEQSETRAAGEIPMASKKQLEANRANARLCTGPKSLSGKNRSRLNALKHGLTAKTIIIAGEDPAQFDILRASFEEDYEPRSAIEYDLIERLASLAWRLRRVPVFEAAVIDALKTEMPPPKPPRTIELLEIERERAFAHWVPKVLGEKPKVLGEKPKMSYLTAEERVEFNAAAKKEANEELDRRMGQALIKDSQRSDALGKLYRNEAALLNVFAKTLQMLHFVQSQRLRATS